MYAIINLCLLFLNMGMAIGLVAGALLLLRPLLVKVLPPQKRAWLWMVVWFPAYLPSVYSATNFLLERWIPINFRSFISPRIDGVGDTPTYFPGRYSGTKDYNLFLPGGQLFQVELREEWMTLLAVIWLAAALGLTAYGWWKNTCLLSQAREGELLKREDALWEKVPERYRGETLVRICPGLPASFVRSGIVLWDDIQYDHEIFLQKELPPEQMELVLCHEVQHIRLRHCIWKGYANVAIYLYWWNPLIWLSYRYFCRDLELACDRAVLEELDRTEQRTYARALVEIGSGRQLWEMPLSFGECDAQIRVKAVVNWRPSAPWWSIKNLAGVALTLGLMLFFLAGPLSIEREEDKQLVWQQQVEQAETVRFPVYGLGNSDYRTVELLQLWAQYETSEGKWEQFYGLDKNGNWWMFKLLWSNKLEYQAIGVRQNPNTPQLIERGELVQLR